LENLLLDEKLNIKLCDFGVAQKLPPSGLLEKPLMSKNGYMAPEVFRKDPLWSGEKADMFSFGVCCFKMLTGREAFEEPSPKCRFFTLLMSGDWDKCCEAYQCRRPSEEWIGVLNRLLAIDPKNRASSLDQFFL
jgi:serine/threonine protein kinase